MIKLLNIIKFVFCYLWSLINFTRTLIINIIFILLISLFCYYIYNINHKKNINNKILKKNHQVLEINFDENFDNDSFYKNNLIFKLFNKFTNKKNNNLIINIVNAINFAKKDKNIDGIILKLHNLNIYDLPNLRYIGKYLNDFKNSGKKIYAISDMYDQNQYYLASFANKIFLLPYGYVKLYGINFKKFFFKKFLKNLKVKTHIFKVGKYKSAVEIFARKEMSNDDKIVMSQLINNLWDDYLTTISINRQLTKEEIFPTDENFLISLKKSHGNLTLFALQNKLVDKISDNHDFEKEMIQNFGLDKIQNTYKKININDYIKLYIDDGMQKNNGNIAVIPIDGIMIYGKNGSDIIINQINKVYRDPNIKGLILKINSPGGDILAAKAIYNELILLKKIHKPIVVVMENMAASGAYWISTAADFIIADPVTLTGSIGIFSVVHNISDILDLIGIKKDGVNISDRFNLSMNEKLSSIEEEIMNLNIKTGYNEFISLVSKERNLPIEKVEKIANGMVFLGKDAQKYGLIDDLGDFDNAIMKIVQLTKIKKIKLQWINIDTFSPLNFFLKSNNFIMSNLIQNYINFIFNKNFSLNNEKFLNFKKTYSLCVI
ncbi:signal peptide peptidase SppA [Enterobacteriaceae endosymbiont of Donacia bicoloricornis]|uniref:signal peptide peptidase SppA n=1 Tax=Enterobacteriaceae endosymbiont of Donacia bicoloricornis TaxID=2675772 RepID=UPI0014491EC2|nr:signal peptide peptidase SppA [Enterobacteriaceae endosymbiont of Donacia bicoloricornis]QJC37630.1 signal peptide peptidase SppA [Enterobacteriaceae endosymbiont of Donacia bicoloricornis]